MFVVCRLSLPLDTCHTLRGAFSSQMQQEMQHKLKCEHVSASAICSNQVVQTGHSFVVAQLTTVPVWTYIHISTSLSLFLCLSVALKKEKNLNSFVSSHLVFDFDLIQLNDLQEAFCR